jgi:ADP-ribosylglycohydrolase
MNDKIAGCLFGMALGDALGAETEFLTLEGILRQFPPNGPLEPPGNPARVTDDTQMALAVGDALLQAPRPYAPDTLAPLLTKTFSDWYDDPENNRAPGVTCLDSIENLMEGQRWCDATNISSKGCGANMRVQPVGLLREDAETRAALAQFQAAITHGHPTALASADLTAWVIADLLRAGAVGSLLPRVRAYAESQRKVYHAVWLGDLYQRAIVFPSGADFMAHGWDECLGMIARVESALAANDLTTDPCLLVGKGWIAEEAFATALYCFLLYPDDPVAGMRRAAVSSGDSDSIACIAGSFAGAHCGLGALPASWVARIEYHDRLTQMAADLSALWTSVKTSN